MTKHIQAILALAALGLATSLASCGGGGGEGIDLSDPCRDFGICGSDVDNGDDEMTVTPSPDRLFWFSCEERNVCVEYRYASLSRQNSAIAQCQNSSSLYLGRGLLCNRDRAFGGITQGCRQTNSAGDVQITYEINPTRTRQEYAQLCRSHGGTPQY